jgi:hypothetical protein
MREAGILMGDWLSFLHAVRVSFVFWLPGMLHRWSRKGLRGDAAWQFLLESFFAGLVASGVVLGSFFLFSRNDAGPKLIKGLCGLGTEGLAKALSAETGFFVVLFAVASCLLGWSTGLVIRKTEGRATPKKFSLGPASSLDVELFRLRSLGRKPHLTVRLRNGTELIGTCRTYTFTEPRELMLEVAGGESDREKKLAWLRLDEQVERVEIEAEDVTRSKCVSLRKRLRRKEIEE